MTRDEGFFIGWAAQAPRADRRFLLLAGLGLVAGATAAGAAFARRGPPPGDGEWDQADMRQWHGRLVRTPYPTLILADGRAALLGTPGKLGVQARIPDGIGDAVIVTASPVVRGDALLLAVVEGEGWMRAAASPHLQTLPPEEDLGPHASLGEILDAKCWFGAMRPGHGVTHKSCAVLCVRGGLPLAFGDPIGCGGSAQVSLLLDERGRPHGPGLLRFIGAPVLASGRRVRRHGLVELRAPLSGLRLV